MMGKSQARDVATLFYFYFRARQSGPKEPPRLRIYLRLPDGTELKSSFRFSETNWLLNVVTLKSKVDVAV